MKALVTGGGGFLGRRIVELLLGAGNEVTFFARGRYPEVEALGATGFQADLRDRDAVARIVEGHAIVFHVAAKAAPPWGDRREFHAVNVQGTKNVLDACAQSGVSKFIYTSTPSVTGRSGNVENGNPDLPYPDRYASPYGETKAEAERMVMTANGSRMATVSLRPPLIFGPRDPNLLPRIVERGAKGRLRIIGDGQAVIDFTFIDNAAWAHLDAANALVDYTSPCAGKAYFVSNAEPVKLWEFVNTLLEELGYPPVTKRVPYAVALRVARIMELAWKYLPFPGEPPLTPVVVDGLAHSHWYDPEPARRDISYYPRVPMSEAIARTVTWFAAGPRVKMGS